MKPITFENIRRFVAGRKKKERAESSFKRSDSFKRISIRKNYLDRGGKATVLEKPTTTPQKKEPVQEKAPVQETVPVPDSLVIGYGQWIKCMRAEDYEHLKELTKAVAKEVPPTPPPRKKYSSPSADSSLEILKLDTSPVPVRRRFRKSPPAEERSDSGLSISLGRVWMDAPLAMANAPRSLELPRPSASVELDPTGRRIHHSLESALKERRDARPLSPTPLIMPNPSAICRTLSSTTQTTSTSKTISSRGSTELLSSSKDSGFSFSISIPRLSDLSPTSSGGGFFCKKKQQKPRTSSNRENYFKRTTNSNRKKKSNSTNNNNNRKKSSGSSVKSDMYQVIINRPPRCLKSLKLDPMIFVPPEKRKASNTMRKPVKLEVQEIRDYCSPRDDYDDEDEGLYECISEEDESDAYFPLEEEDEEEEELVNDDLFDDLLDDYDIEEEEELLMKPIRERSRPVRRRKSTKKNCKYVAKPSIHRAPSTLKRNKKLLKKTGISKINFSLNFRHIKFLLLSALLSICIGQF
ncbi:hypothetical protein O3M35_002292 [Rhynocoris fuscipes]|uniref:Uncharacterized protein n=1 Tax=Rhynocoris fuscipes TaxID=488301 RepID=A0AAW1CJT8_9HEMI